MLSATPGLGACRCRRSLSSLSGRWRPRGLRYEPSTGHSEVNGKLANMINIRTDLEMTVVKHIFENPTEKNFAPRLGFAWDPFGDGKTSVRAGFGLFYNIQMSEIDRISTTSNAPLHHGGQPPGAVPHPL